MKRGADPSGVRNIRPGYCCPACKANNTVSEGSQKVRIGLNQYKAVPARSCRKCGFLGATVDFAEKVS